MSEFSFSAALGTLLSYFRDTV